MIVYITSENKPAFISKNNKTISKTKAVYFCNKRTFGLRLHISKWQNNVQANLCMFI